MSTAIKKFLKVTMYHFIEENTNKIGKFLFSDSEQDTLKHSSTNLFMLSPSSHLCFPSSYRKKNSL